MTEDNCRIGDLKVMTNAKGAPKKLNVLALLMLMWFTSLTEDVLGSFSGKLLAKKYSSRALKSKSFFSNDIQTKDIASGSDSIQCHSKHVLPNYKWLTNQELHSQKENLNHHTRVKFSKPDRLLNLITLRILDFHAPYLWYLPKSANWSGLQNRVIRFICLQFSPV